VSSPMSNPRRVLGSALAGLLALLALVGTSAPAHATTPSGLPRVVGGVDVAIDNAPWQVLFIIDSKRVCGGAVVSPSQVLSAAHCFADVPTSSVEAWAGVSRLSERSATSQLAISAITVHPNFDATTFVNDLAIVTLAREIPARLGALVIALPSSEDPTSWPSAGSTAIISGWGETDPASPVASDVLQAATVQVLAGPGDVICGDYGATYVASSQICAGALEGGVDACQGDSGGPLMMYRNGEPVLAGVSSTGFECAAAGYPGLYVRTTSYLPWLEENGVNTTLAGGGSTVSIPGTDREGVLAPFRVGVTYPRADFASYAGMSAAKSRLKVTSGKACRQVNQSVRIVAPGKCFVTVSKGRRSVPLILTVYAS